MRRKASFTLLEILLCLVLLTTLGVLGGYKGFSLYRERAYHAGCQRIREEIFLSKSLAANFSLDIEFTLTQTKKGVVFERKTDQPPSTVSTCFGKKTTLPFLALSPLHPVIKLHFFSSGEIKGDPVIEVTTTYNSKERETIVPKRQKG